MSGAAAARERLLGGVRALYRDIWQAGEAYAARHQAALGQADLVQALQAAAHLALAIEALAKAAEAANRQCRALLAEVMLETGCTHTTDGTLSAYLSRKRKILSVDDAARVPPQYLTRPEPEPDRKAIREALERGEDVPGVSVITPNEMTLNLRVEAHP